MSGRASEATTLRAALIQAVSGASVETLRELLRTLGVEDPTARQGAEASRCG